MKFSSLLIAAVAIAVGTSAAHATIIDDFSSGSLSPYTQTTVLDNNTTRDVTFSISNGGLIATSTSPDTQAEQNLLLRSDFSLGIGQVLRADVSFPSGSQSQDFGIAVAATAAQTAVASGAKGDTRSAGGGYFFAGFRGTSTQFIGSGANPAAIPTASALQAGNSGTPISPAMTGFFISRTSIDTFALGYTNANGDTTVGSFTVPDNNAVGIGNAIGFYTDERSGSSIGTMDNLRIEAVPEPASLGLLALGAVGLLARRRR